MKLTKSQPSLRQLALAFLCIIQLPVIGQERLALDRIQAAIENARLAEAVYDLSIKQIGEWHQIKSQTDPDGFKAAVYERSLGNGQRDLRIVYAGTDDIHDVANDVNQGSFIS